MKGHLRRCGQWRPPGAGPRQAVGRWERGPPVGGGGAGEEPGTAKSWSNREGGNTFLLSSHLLSKPNRTSEAFEGWEPSHTVHTEQARESGGGAGRATEDTLRASQTHAPMANLPCHLRLAVHSGTCLVSPLPCFIKPQIGCNI